MSRRLIRESSAHLSDEVKVGDLGPKELASFHRSVP